MNFIDELLEEAEIKEHQNQEAYFDLVLVKIRHLETDIEKVRNQTEEEIKIIKDFTINKELKLQEEIDFLKKKLEIFLREKELKSLKLPNGEIKIRKKPDKVEIVDIEKFLAAATKDMITTVPEEIKPNLPKIKKFIKMTTKIPAGVNVIEGEEEFYCSVKID